jgi:phosphoglycerol transferase MdoB-like AlkP superfamily enzyme
MYNDILSTDGLLVIWHGLRLDLAIAGYLSMIPGLILIFQEIKTYGWYHWIWKGYFFVTSLLYSLAIIANLGLYGYWGFPLDNTPLLYLKTSPKDAFASVPIWQTIALLIIIILIAGLIYKVFIKVTKQHEPTHTPIQRLSSAIALLILTATLILPIRGGISTGTNHTGSVYFSPDIKLNHAAVNPAFCFFESVSHQKQDLSTMYRFMDNKEAEKIFQGMIKIYDSEEFNSENLKRNVLLIILESFSDSIMHVSGVTPKINKLAAEGLYFPNFYASSTRTDRALASILSGVPAQPTMTILDVPRISNKLPSIASSLSIQGYDTHFYYGGDTNYSNMQSYLMATGFQHVTSETGFPTKERICKWGAPDEYVYNKLFNDIKATDKKWFKVILTESSHEPFDVPYKSKDTNIASSDVLNAFAYSDKCLGDFINKMRTLPCWSNTMVVIVADHLGAFPENIDNYKQWRYHIPFIILNVDMDIDVNVTAGQADIPATILSILGYSHHEFLFSKDMRDADAPHFAFFSFPDAMGMVKDGRFMVYDNNSNQLQGASELEGPAKAYLQKLYDYLSKK